MEDCKNYVKTLKLGPEDIIIIMLKAYNSYKSSTLKDFSEKIQKLTPYDNSVILIPEESKVTVIKKDEDILGIDWDI